MPPPLLLNQFMEKNEGLGCDLFSISSPPNAYGLSFALCTKISGLFGSMPRATCPIFFVWISSNFLVHQALTVSPADFLTIFL